MTNTLFSDNKIPKEGNQHICIASVCIDSILELDKKSYPEASLKQIKYKIK